MNESQMIGVEMTEPLIISSRYNVQFFVSLMDSSWYAIRNMGVHFSEDAPPDNIESLLNLIPQIEYDGDAFLNDKEGWMRISLFRFHFRLIVNLRKRSTYFRHTQIADRKLQIVHRK